MRRQNKHSIIQSIALLVTHGPHRLTDSYLQLRSKLHYLYLVQNLLPGFEQVCDKSLTFFLLTAFKRLCRMQVSDVTDLMEFGQKSAVRLCQNSIKSILTETCLRLVANLLKTCPTPGFKQVLSEIEVMEFGLSAVNQRSRVCAKMSAHTNWQVPSFG